MNDIVATQEVLECERHKNRLHTNPFWACVSPRRRNALLLHCAESPRLPRQYDTKTSLNILRICFDAKPYRHFLLCILFRIYDDLWSPRARPGVIKSTFSHLFVFMLSFEASIASSNQCCLFWRCHEPKTLSFRLPDITPYFRDLQRQRVVRRRECRASYVLKREGMEHSPQITTRSAAFKLPQFSVGC